MDRACLFQVINPVFQSLTGICKNYVLIAPYCLLYANMCSLLSFLCKYVLLIVFFMQICAHYCLLYANMKTFFLMYSFSVSHVSVMADSIKTVNSTRYSITNKYLTISYVQ